MKSYEVRFVCAEKDYSTGEEFDSLELAMACCRLEQAGDKYAEYYVLDTQTGKCVYLAPVEN